MLVLSRKKNETLVIAGLIEVSVVSIRGDKVRLGISAPADIAIDRQEVHEAKLHKIEELLAGAGAVSEGTVIEGAVTDAV